MRVTKHEGSEERRVLTAMIVSTVVVASVAPRWDREGMFSSPFANLIGKWAVEYYNRHKEAIGKSITARFVSHEEDYPKDVNNADVGYFISSLSDEYEIRAEEINDKYMVDLAARHFGKIRANRLMEAAKADMDSGRFERADERLRSYRTFELAEEAGINFLEDEESFRSAFASKGEAIIKFSGARGEFYSHTLCRDGFIVFAAPEKRGKTWGLLDMAWTAVTQRRKTVFFSIGDMSKDQITLRFATRIARKPLYSCTVKYPVSLEVPDTIVVVTHEDQIFDIGLSADEGWKAVQRVKKARIKSEHTYFKLVCRPAGLLDVFGIRSILRTWAEDGWIADVVVIDYMDLLASPRESRTMDKRDQINETWIQMRALNLETHTLIVSATQANRKAYDAPLIRMEHISEDKRKLAHPTGIVGLNSIPSEKRKGLMRLNWPAVRELDMDVARCVYMAGCLSLANPCVLSCWAKTSEEFEKKGRKKNAKEN